MALSTTPSNAVTFALKSSLVLPAGAEIAAFDPTTDRVFVTSDAGLQIVNFADPAAPTLISTIDFVAAGFGSNNVSSVAFKNGVLAVSIIATDKTLPGVLMTAVGYAGGPTPKPRPIARSARA
ncbi:MAG: hypothetical protein HC897_10715 [Thermoanaerobaculia bacterium]|nr:hypothetical protein [Thermoanaerobaculia bacterium]